MTHTSTEQPEALRLADIVERLNVGVHSQAIAEEYSAAAAELRRLHERDMRADVQIKELLQVIEDLERGSKMLSQRVRELGETARENRSRRVIELEQRIAEMEEQMASIGAGGVEPLRGSHQARECREALAACINLLKKTPKITQNIYVGKDRQSWGAQAKIVLEAALAAQAKKVEQQ